MIYVAIIGAGQLGSRHLQALANSENQLHIQVIDPNVDSLKIAETRFNEVISSFKGTVEYATDISKLSKKVDVAIVATNSKIRKTVIEQLVAVSEVKNLILEKFLFTKESDYLETEQLISKHNIKTWVNCARRMMPFYQNLKQQIEGPIHFTAIGNAWGLGCNGIHLLDLFAFLSQKSNITLSNNLIDTTIIESKRNGYVEFTGTITGTADNNSFHITSFPENSSALQIIINTPKTRYSIAEGAPGKIWISKLENQWQWEEHTFNILFQSQMTHLVVDKIIAEGKCDLPEYAESAKLHLIFLNNLLNFSRKINNNNAINECLIT